MRLTFRTKLLASHVGLVAAVVLIVILELNRSLGADLRGQLDDRLEQQATGAASWIGDGRRHPEKLAGRLAQVVHAEVTIFDRDGAVLGDSAEAPPPSAPQQLPEVDAARAGEVGHATRTLGVDEMHYVAVPAADGLVVRLGAPMSGIHQTLASLRHRLIFALALAGIAALVLGTLASRIASRPLRAMTDAATRIAKGDYDIDVPTSSPDEFGILGKSLVALATELKARIGDLVAERDRLTAIFAGMAEGVVVLDADGRILSANPAAGQILQVHGPIVERRLAELPIDEHVKDVVGATLAGGELREQEIETTRAGRVLEVYARPIAARGVVTVLRDMTRMHKLLTMRRDFVANVSHELRTPVTAIQGYAETLLRGAPDAATSHQFLEIIHRQAKRLGALVEGLLRLSELEARPPEEATRETFDVSAIAKNVAQTLKERAASFGARLELDVEEGLTATGDAAGMEQVVENLVDNAIKYGKKTGGTVTIRARSSGAREAMLSVVDDGPGIEERHLAHVFERFYRVDPSRSRERGGSGLGLAIVKHLVEAMGGTVGVASKMGEGSTFTVTIPRA